METMNMRYIMTVGLQKTRNDALAHLKVLESFEFIYVFTTLQPSLLYLKEAAVKLPGPSQEYSQGNTTAKAVPVRTLAVVHIYTTAGKIRVYICRKCGYHITLWWDHFRMDSKCRHP